MSVNFNKITLGEKFKIKFSPEETILLITKPKLKACLGNQIKIIVSYFLFNAGVVVLVKIIAYLLKQLMI